MTLAFHPLSPSLSTYCFCYMIIFPYLCLLPSFLFSLYRGSSSVLPSRQIYIEQLRISTSELLVSMHTTSQLPEDLAAIKKSLGFPLVQFESPIILEGFNKSHMLGRPVVFVDSITKHYKKVNERPFISLYAVSTPSLSPPLSLLLSLPHSFSLLSLPLSLSSLSPTLSLSSLPPLSLSSLSPHSLLSLPLSLFLHLLSLRL